MLIFSRCVFPLLEQWFLFLADKILVTQHGKRQEDKFSLHTSPFEVWRNSLHLKKKKGRKKQKRIFSEKEVSLEEKLEGSEIETPLSEFAKAIPWCFPQNCSLLLLLCHLCSYKLGCNLSSFQRICWSSQRIAESPRQVSTLAVTMRHVSHFTESTFSDSYSLVHPLSWTLYHRSVKLPWQKPPPKFSGSFFLQNIPWTGKS